MKTILPAMILLQFTAPTFADDAGIRFFERRVRPLLVKHCYECHSEEAGESNGELLVDSRDGLLKGGQLGPAIKPGKPDGSLLLEAVSYSNEDLLMPPKKRLSEDEIAVLKKWIKMGAPDPRRANVTKKDESIDFVKARQHWAFRPIETPKLPNVNDSEWPLQTMDRFILARLESEGLKPNEPADPVTLMRRVYYDLTGLPPTPEQQRVFLEAAEKDFDNAYEQLVDQLLRSPAFGERWARHWLDVVHYAETIVKPRNFVNPLIWKYRDYVIGAYNADKPFDQFITEQLAGDLLPANDLAQRREQLVATGMLLTGQRAYGGSAKSPQALEYHADDIDDQLNVIGHAFLGLSIACARCHDHKFDPIPTKDYYAMAGILRSTASYNSRITPPLSADSTGGPTAPASARYVAMPDAAEEIELAGEMHDKVEGTRAQLRRLEQGLAKIEQQAKKETPGQDTELIALRKKVAGVRAKLAKLEAKLPEPVHAEKVSAVADLPNPGPQPLFIKGDSANPGPVVPRGFLQVVPIASDSIKIPNDQSGRLELAQWLTSPDNPLVARVYVNRVWQHLFGVGIVESADNFGIMGQPPSHPKLLDHLAAKFREEGWSTKRLIRQLVLSRTYRLSSNLTLAESESKLTSSSGQPPGVSPWLRATSDAMQRDPSARLRWRMTPRRLEAEAIRDTILMASQQLVAGSPGPSEAARQGFQSVRSVAVSYDIPHRSVYLSILREAVPHQLEVFDFPDPAFIRGTRAATTMPTQALYMMNSRFVTDASRLTARHVIEGAGKNTTSRSDLAIRTILGRPAKPSEIRQIQQHVDTAMASGVEAEVAWSRLCQVLFASTEFRYVW